MFKKWTFFRVLVLFALALDLLPAREPGLSAWASPEKTTVSKECSQELERRGHESALGLVDHAEHWVDLLVKAISQGAQSPSLSLFETVVRELVAEFSIYRLGREVVLNEKIDGSPSVALGFDSQQRPFIAYKKHLDAEKQKLLTSRAEAKKFHKGELADLYSVAIETFETALSGLASRKVTLPGYTGSIQDLIFQGDVLFFDAPHTEGAPDKRVRILKTEDSVLIQANALNYRIQSVGADAALYKLLSRSRFAIALHTVTKRVVDRTTGRISAEPFDVQSLSLADRRDLISKVASYLNGALENGDGFVLDPFHRNVIPQRPFRDEDFTLLEERLHGIREAMRPILSRTAANGGAGALEREITRFLNSQVRPPSSGGLYRWVRNGLRLDDARMDRLIRRFRGFVTRRQDSGTVSGSEFSKILPYFESGRQERRDLEGFFRAYAQALEIQQWVDSHLEPHLKSKLGGGAIEGLFLQTDARGGGRVKWVDRLGFTTLNNSKREPRAAGVSGTEENFSSFLSSLSPGDAVFPMKGQPIHIGHVGLIRSALKTLKKRSPGATLHVLLSPKEPNLSAKELDQLGATETKGALETGEYKYVFSGSLKREILEAALIAEIRSGQVQVHLRPPSHFWSEIKFQASQVSARPQSKPWLLVMGQKEWDIARYDEELEYAENLLEPIVIPMQAGSISGTEVREAIRTLNVNSPQSPAYAGAFKTLEYSLSMVGDLRKRRALMKRILSEWKALDETATGLLSKHPPRKRKKSPDQK